MLKSLNLAQSLDLLIIERDYDHETSVVLLPLPL